MSIATMDNIVASEPPNFLIENRKDLADLYYKAIGEKEALKKKVEYDRYYQIDDCIKEIIQIDNLIKAIARIVFP